MSKQLSDSGKELVALALLLLKDFQCDGKFDADITISIIGLADYLGVREQYDKIVVTVPPMKITPRY